MSTTLIASLTLSDSPPPPADPAGLQEWLDDRIADATASMAEVLDALLVERIEEFAAGLTAAGSPGVWEEYVERDLAPYFGGIFRGGGVLAYVGAQPPPSLQVGWTEVINQDTLDYTKVASNRLRGVSDEQWLQVKAKLHRAVRDGEGRESLSKWLREEQGHSAARAETIARTEVVGAYNNGDYRGALALGDFGPRFKSWLATHDARTRPTHIDANGQTVEFRQPFAVGGAKMLYPHDPAGPPAETVNCRCTTLHYYPGDTLPSGDVVPEDDLPSPGPKRPEWAEGFRDVDPSATKRWFDFDPNTGTRSPNATANGMLDDILHNGRLVDQELQRRIGSGPNVDVLHRDWAKAKKKADRLGAKSTDHFRERMSDVAEEMGKTRDDWFDVFHGPGKRFDSMEDAREWLSQIDPRYRRMREAWWNADNEAGRLKLRWRTAQEGGNVTNFADELEGVLGDLRPLTDPDLARQVAVGESARAANGARALRFYPEDWSRRRGTILFDQLDDSKRAYARGAEVHIPGGDLSREGVYVHEIAHTMENAVPGIKEMEWTFWRRRKGLEEARPLNRVKPGSGYEDWEQAIMDEFAEPYIGKVYADADQANWELLSMGIEGLHGNRFSMWSDLATHTEYRQFILGLLASL